MADDQLHASIIHHLRASGEPVREAFLYERVGGSGTTSPEHFQEVLLHMEVEGQLHMDPVHDERRDPPPFQPRFWRVAD